MAFSDLTDAALSAVRDTFGEEVTYKAPSTADQVIKGVYNERSIEVVAGVTQVVSARPNLLVKIADLQDEPRQRDLVVIRGVTYRVAEVEKDGEGGAVLYLNKTT